MKPFWIKATQPTTTSCFGLPALTLVGLPHSLAFRMKRLLLRLANTRDQLLTWVFTAAFFAVFLLYLFVGILLTT
ncbi:hypothetical protein [Hymenobacter canadensis]|uniref:Uncharacterized protein n=1 Tax=Hymenobacter canadensis TaxID=2999067 RepID=A0ABY7LUN7_9BACT|nr:hypothetical protein [Hymenobacter canadensis]WBA44106.1 hypothetical protein O3303_19650 [Hymenobacter canadensis]